ncbi:AAA family ATPase [Clostridium tyrobutyricum]|uniref:AAA family ATPase n=1 Tax=Clostridium tyrobutyricum TaxID=1519 RepID=UPI001C38F5E0|nr:AAA family ATPase [Clostridium tyrobutyricum]MBV4418925.1 AAA family ATPase [Clostridium tyrobutyricum]
MGNFYIKSVYIDNFRGYESLKEPFVFSCDNKDVKMILLTGANGYGKTSLLEAIEWCFTGTVERLERDFRSRCKNKEATTDKANKGILRNRNGERKPVFVKVEAIYKKKSIVIERKFEESLDIDGYKLSLPKVTCEDSDIKNEFVKELEKVIYEFNDRYICSYEKNIILYNKGRKDIYEMFSCFYRDNIEAKNILSNIEEVKKRLETEEEEIKDNLESIRKNKDDSLKVMENVQSIIGQDVEKEIYPNNSIYRGENTNPYGYLKAKNKDDKTDIHNEFNSHISTLTKISVNVIYNNLSKYKQYLSNSMRLNDFITLKSIYENNLNIINKLKAIDLYSIENSKLSIEQKISALEKIKSYKEFESNYTSVGINEQLSNHEKKVVEEKNNKIKGNFSEIVKLNEKIKLYSTDNPTTKLLRLIVDNINGFNKYRESDDTCPLCGSREKFSTSELGLTAKKYLGEQDEQRQNIAKLINEFEKSNQVLIEEIINYTSNIYIRKLINIQNLIKLKGKVENYLNLAQKYSIDYKLITIEFLEENISELTDNIKSLNFNVQREEELLNVISSYNHSTLLIEFQNSLKKINYINLPLNRKYNLLNEALLNLKNEVFDVDDLLLIGIEELNLKDIEKRINICKYIKYNIELSNINSSIKSINEQEVKIDGEHKKISREIKKITKIIKEIKKVIKETEINQVSRIAEPLDEIYRKITRNTNIRRINFHRANTQNGNAELEVIDLKNNKSPFANILSSGQISTLAISIFLSKAMINKNQLMRCYFMDEPIQTMDDLNVLSFVDLLRFQLSEKSNNNIFMDQIFISTCDNDLERLILHKMKSFGVGICRYKFEGPEKFIRQIII